MTSTGDHPLGLSRRLLQKIKLTRPRSAPDPGKGEWDYRGFLSLELSQIHLGKLRSKIIFSRPDGTRGQVDEKRGSRCQLVSCCTVIGWLGQDASSLNRARDVSNLGVTVLPE